MQPDGDKGGQDLHRALARVPLFHGLGPADLDGLIALTRAVTVGAGEVIVRDGQPGAGLYIILSGQVRVVSDVPAERALLAHLGPGEFFGEMSLLRNELTAAAVVADTDSELLLIGAQDFLSFAEQRPGVAKELERLAGRRSGVSLRRFENEASSLLALSPSIDQVRIGRHPSNEIVLDSPWVSEYHARIVRVNGGLELVDLGSLTGTLLNRVPVRHAALADGDVIAIGLTRLFLLDGVIKLFQSRRGIRLEAQALCRDTREGRRILDGVSVTMHPGELVAIVGPSGAGKTTLLHLLTGLDAPSSGDILFDGIPAQQSLPALRGRLGYVPQYDTVHLELTVEQSLRFTGRLRLPRDVSSGELDSRIHDLLETVRLTGREHQIIGQLSGGQRKRTCVAAELLSDPGILFLDEPTSGLDPGLDLQMMHQLRELADEGRTVILTTHATRNIGVCDRVVILDRGMLVFQGPPAEALRHFQVEDFVDIYAVLERSDPLELRAQFHTSAEFSTQPASAVGPESGEALPATRTNVPVRPLRQFGQLVRRDVRVLVHDRVNMALRLFGAPVLALLQVSTFDGSIFALQRADGGSAQQAITLLYLASAICLFLGAFTAANVITREAGIFRRERLVNLSPAAYVLAKVAVLSVFSVLQGFLFIGILSLRITLPGNQLATASELAAVMALVSFAGMAMGLFISSLSANADRAAILVVLALIPQLIFAGSTVPRSEMTPFSRVISDATVTKWSLELAGGLTHLDERLDVQATQTIRPPGSDQPLTVQNPVRPFEGAFRVSLPWRWVALLGFAGIFIAGTFVAQAQKGRPRGVRSRWDVVGRLRRRPSR